MNTQTIFNLAILLILIASFSSNIVIIDYILNKKHVSKKRTTVFDLIVSVAYVTGWGIFLTLSLFAREFMIEKITLFFNP